MFVLLHTYGSIMCLVALIVIVPIIVIPIMCFLVKRYCPQRRVHLVKTLIVMGSGGHTSEMLRLISAINPSLYTPRVYIMAKLDLHSEKKIIAAEKEHTDFVIVKVPRSRSVHQSYTSSIFTTLYAILYCIPLLFYHWPDVVLCNGPGTCVPICFVANTINMFRWTRTRIVFIESICRVKDFSLTGKMLYLFADDVITQWNENRYIERKRSKYFGRLV